MSTKYVIKILTLGDSTVGKSSLVLRYSDNKFDDHLFSTIGIDFRTKYIKIGDSSVKVLIWDTAGQEKFQTVAKHYYKGANGVLLTYDISKRKSFNRIEFWLKELKENNKIDDLVIYLVGNKIDLEDKREISEEEGKKYAKENNINFFEASAKTGQGVNKLFNQIIKKTVDKIIASKGKEEAEDKKILDFFLDKPNKEKQKRCC